MYGKGETQEKGERGTKKNMEEEEKVGQRRRGR
jgi:hypothetical protein